jgi:type II secretory pathway pseudopilin PulG
MLNRRNGLKRTAAFTLIEAALTTIIVGVGAVSILQLLAAGTVSNVNASDLTTGSNIAKDIHEAMIQMSYAQVLAVNGATYKPPIDSRSQAISNLSDWQQSIVVQPVNPDNLTQNVVNSDPDAVRVTVSVSHNSDSVCSESWYSFKP